MGARVAAVIELAPAKVNLCLHVTGRRADGYHELDSIVAFADLGDRIRLEVADNGAFLQVSAFGTPGGSTGDAQVVPGGVDNLAWQALALGARAAGGVAGVRLAVDKHLPAGAGLGGGSSDAAAVLRALARLDAASDPGPVALSEAVRGKALGLGADVPMCLDPRPWRARGIGERLQAVALGRDLPAVLVWPGRAVSTPAVFAARAGGFGEPVPPSAVARLGDDPIAALAGLRNDLAAAASAVEPAIGEALAALARLPGCRLVRMSGSGSAVFGLFDDAAAAGDAAATLRRRRPDWWVRATRLRSGRVETWLDDRR